MAVIFMLSEEYIMPIQTAKIINNGNNQLLALPKEFFFDTTEVYINKQGDHLIISPINTTWDAFFNSTSAFDEDFLIDREDGLPQEREF
jgi:antitoxin VapB